MITKSIIDLLLEKKKITNAQALECQSIAEENGKTVEQCLLEKNYVTSEDLGRAFAERAGLPFVEKITDAMADLTILAKIPLKFLRDNVVIPVIVDNQLTILTANPTNFQPLDDINMLLGGNARSASCNRKSDHRCYQSLLSA